MRVPRSLTGLVLTAGDPGYDEARLDYNTALPPRFPLYINYGRAVSDISRAVRFSRGHRLCLRARSGGHSYEGYSVATGAVVADVSRLDEVRFNRASGLAEVGAGAPLLAVYQKLWDQGRVTIPAGSCASVGTAGLTLGGGFGLVSRAFGLTADALSALEMVGAGGEVVGANAVHRENLFWASRGGGGGNFGIVTRFWFRTFPVGLVTTFAILWPWVELGEVMRSFQVWADPRRLDRRIVPLLKLTSRLAGQVLAVGEFLGPKDELVPLLRPLLLTGHPVRTTITERSYIDAVYYFAGVKPGEPELLAQGPPPGTLDSPPGHEMFKNTSAYQMELFPDEAIETMVRHLSASRNPATLVQFDGMGGAVSDVPVRATAFPHRRARASLQYQAYWERPGEAAENVRWVEGFRQAMLPWTSGAYVNYIDRFNENWPQAYYGDNLERLVRVKKAYDPANVFRFPQGLSELTGGA